MPRLGPALRGRSLVGNAEAAEADDDLHGARNLYIEAARLLLEAARQVDGYEQQQLRSDARRAVERAERLNSVLGASDWPRERTRSQEDVDVECDLFLFLVGEAGLPDEDAAAYAQMLVQERFETIPQLRAIPRDIAGMLNIPLAHLDQIRRAACRHCGVPEARRANPSPQNSLSIPQEQPRPGIPVRMIANAEERTDAPGLWVDHEVPERSCIQELRENQALRELVPNIGELVNDVQQTAADLLASEHRLPALPQALSASELTALLALTHSHSGHGRRDQNLGVRLNAQLGDSRERARVKRTWSALVCYLVSALHKLPMWVGVVYRGLPASANAASVYSSGKRITWGTFTSTTTNVDHARQLAGEGGAILAVHTNSGRNLQPFSFDGAEGEILLPPSLSFFVCGHPQVQDGILTVHLQEV